MSQERWLPLQAPTVLPQDPGSSPSPHRMAHCLQLQFQGNRCPLLLPPLERHMWCTDIHMQAIHPIHDKRKGKCMSQHVCSCWPKIVHKSLRKQHESVVYNLSSSVSAPFWPPGKHMVHMPVKHLCTQNKWIFKAKKIPKGYECISL